MSVSLAVLKSRKNTNKNKHRTRHYLNNRKTYFFKDCAKKITSTGASPSTFFFFNFYNNDDLTV